MEKRSSQPSAWRLQHLLYLLASLPFVLFAALWFFGAFNQPSTKPAPSPKPSATASPQNDATARPISSTDPAERMDTAPHHPPGKNAADFYKQAYALFNQLSAEEKNMILKGIHHSKESPELLRKTAEILTLIRAAKAAGYTEWGLRSAAAKWDDRNPQVALVVRLSTVITWSAAEEFSAAPSQALNDLALGSLLVASVKDVNLSGNQFGLLNNQSTWKVVVQNAAYLTTAELDLGLQLLKNNAAQIDFSQTLQANAGLAGQIALSLLDPQTRDQTYRSVFGSDPPAEDIATLITDVQWGEHAFQELPQKILLSEDAYQSWFNAFKLTANGNTVQQATIKSMELMRNQYMDFQVESSMSRAGLSVIRSGGDQLSKFPDPSNGLPFILVPTATGFELRSPYQFQGKPVAMPFPTAKP